MVRLATYWHTLRHLKPVQLYGRAVRLLPLTPSVDGPVPPLAAPRGAWERAIRSPIAMERPGVFRFLNEERDLGWPVDWSARDASLLWRYNLHYFDDLNAADADRRAESLSDVIEQWISANPPGTGPAWDSYPLSLRIVNWVKWSLHGGELSSAALASLARQVRWLTGRIEWHLLGNHLFANAKAILFAGCFFGGDEADDWLETGTNILASELDEQVLADGGNFELSPMYHAIFLEDVLDLVNLARLHPGKIDAELERNLRQRGEDMLGWMAAMIHPDGQIAMFNDSAIGIAPSFAELADYSQRLGIAVPERIVPDACRIERLGESGYARLECPYAVALCDVARVGPDYLPGHAHADTLSFELSVGGRRIIVNGGTSRYGHDAERLRERGTAAHSTVEVDGENSSEVWSGFRVARRAMPFAVACGTQQEGVWLEGAHDGYRRLQRDTVHRRRWDMNGDALRIEDVVAGPWHAAVARYIFHSSVRVEKIAPDAWRLRSDDREIRLTVAEGRARLVPVHHSLEFGQRLPTQALVVELGREEGAVVEIAWTI